MNIAADFDCTDLVKEYRRGVLSLIEWQLKTLRAGERIDMMMNLIVVGEMHFRANHNRENGRDKGLIDLIHYR